jgi:putative DNA primase/helicase
MVGVPTGTPIGAFVIDIDAGEDDETGEVFSAEALKAELEGQVGESLPATWAARTPRGGLHLYFGVQGANYPGNRTGLIPRVDVRGEGGYVIVPPSERSDGERYGWEVPPGASPLAWAPAGLLDAIFRRGKWARNGRPSSAKGDQRSVPYTPIDHERPYAMAALHGEAGEVSASG